MYIIIYLCDGSIWDGTPNRWAPPQQPGQAALHAYERWFIIEKYRSDQDGSHKTTQKSTITIILNVHMHIDMRQDISQRPVQPSFGRPNLNMDGLFLVKDGHICAQGVLCVWIISIVSLHYRLVHGTSYEIPFNLSLDNKTEWKWNRQNAKQIQFVCMALIGCAYLIWKKSSLCAWLWLVEHI